MRSKTFAQGCVTTVGSPGDQQTAFGADKTKPQGRLSAAVRPLFEAHCLLGKSALRSNWTRGEVVPRWTSSGLVYVLEN